MANPNSFNNSFFAFDNTNSLNSSFNTTITNGSVAFNGGTVTVCSAGAPAGNVVLTVGQLTVGQSDLASGATVINGFNNSFNGLNNSYTLTVAAYGNDCVRLDNIFNTTVTAYGSNNKVFLSLDKDVTVDDKGANLVLTVSGQTGTLTVTDFQNDPGAIIDLVNAGYASAGEAVVALTPDGHGGTMLPLNTGGHIDFVGVSAQQLVGHISVTNN
jgi:hypothetical protein